MKNTTFNLSPLAKAFAMTTAVALSSQAFAQEETEVKEKDVEKIQVTGSLGSLPGQDVESVFGFGKSILETPRSASTISQEQMERFNVSDIDELVAFAPGTFILWCCGLTRCAGHTWGSVFSRCTPFR